jgi:zinc transporter 1
MNMRALVLHVLGDALGNVGVIATGLVIWKTSWPFKYYFDPIVSLIITLIIFSSALPLGKSVKSSTLARLLLNDLDSAQRLLHSPSGSPFDCFPK